MLTALTPILVLAAPATRLHTGFRYTEGAAVDRAGNLYFTDVPAHRIYRRSTNGKLTLLTRRSGGCVGLDVAANGRLAGAQSAAGRLVKLGPPRWTPNLLVGGLRAANDLVSDQSGGFYVTSPDFRGKKADAIYYVSASRRVQTVARSVRNPNGVALSPDGRTLYVVAYGTFDVLAFSVLRPGALGPGRRLMKLAGPNGKPANTGGDGMAVGPDGTLYVTIPEAKGIHVATPDGRFRRFLPLPEKPSNCAFSPDGRTLYVTAQRSVYAIPL